MINLLTQEHAERLEELHGRYIAGNWSRDDTGDGDEYLDLAGKHLPALLAAHKEAKRLKRIVSDQDRQIEENIIAKVKACEQRDKLLAAMQDIEKFRKTTGLIACPWCGEGEPHRNDCEWVEATKTPEPVASGGE